jgi:pectate lyase
MLSATQTITGTYDGTMRRFVGTGPLGTSGQNEDQGPLFNLANGATLQNAILGNPAADGIHCEGTCTLKNIWWEDVGEDAATLQGTSTSQVMTIDGGGAQKASDKIFQHNGPGTMIIKNFCAQDFGKLYRSCGNCDMQYARHVELQNIMVLPSSATSALAGVNANYNDTAKFSAITIKAATNSLTVCQRYTGNNTGAEPPKSGSGADGTVCMYAASDIIWMP